MADEVSIGALVVHRLRESLVGTVAAPAQLPLNHTRTGARKASRDDKAVADHQEVSQLDLFSSPFSSPPAAKSDIHTLEFPFFSLSKTTRRQLRARAFVDRGVSVEVIPSIEGPPSIWDKDVLIYCASVVTAALDQGWPEEKTRTIRLRPRELLRATDRGVSGRDYLRLADALVRLRGAVIKTSVRAGGLESTAGFGLIESYRWKRGSDDGVLEITLSAWLHRAIAAREVLTVDPRYFLLTSGLARRLYELARKHCGRQTRWRISIERLRQKAGSESPMKAFAFELRSLIDKLAGHQAKKGAQRWARLVDYIVWLPPGRDLLVVYHERAVPNFQRDMLSSLQGEDQ